MNKNYLMFLVGWLLLLMACRTSEEPISEQTLKLSEIKAFVNFEKSLPNSSSAKNAYTSYHQPFKDY